VGGKYNSKSSPKASVSLYQVQAVVQRPGSPHTLPAPCHTEHVCTTQCPQNGGSISTGGVQRGPAMPRSGCRHTGEGKRKHRSLCAPLISKDSQRRPCCTAIALPWLRQSGHWVKHADPPSPLAPSPGPCPSQPLSLPQQPQNMPTE